MKNPNHPKKPKGTPRKQTDPLRVRKGNLRRSYGLSWEEYQILHEVQNGKCPICKCILDITHADTVVDHCHTTKRIRGLLCRKCNMALGLFHDNKESLFRAIEYLGE